MPELARPGEQTPLTVAMDKRLQLAMTTTRPQMPPIAAAEVPVEAGSKSPQAAGGRDANLCTAFRNALDRGDLLEPDSANAYFYYRQLTADPAYRDSLAGLRRALIASILDHVQPFFNQLYVANPGSFLPEDYLLPLQRLEAAKELITSDDLLYHNVSSDHAFLRGAAMSALAEDKDEPALFAATRSAFEEALTANPLASHAYLWQAYADINLADWDQALIALSGSLLANPNYSLPYHLLDQLRARQLETALAEGRYKSKRRQSRKQQKRLEADTEQRMLAFLPDELLNRERLETKGEEALALIQDDYLDTDKFQAIADIPENTLETILASAVDLEARLSDLLDGAASTGNSLLDALLPKADEGLAMDDRPDPFSNDGAGIIAEPAPAPPLPSPPPALPATVGGALETRPVLEAPDLKTEVAQAGRVVLILCVDDAGRVSEARYDLSGSTTSDEDLIQLAIQNALEWRFAPNEKPKTCGTVTYKFDNR